MAAKSRGKTVSRASVGEPTLHVDFRPRPVVAMEAERYKDALVSDGSALAKDLRFVQATHAWLEAPLGTDWILATRLLVQRGRVVVAEVRVFPNEPDRPRIGLSPAEWSGGYRGLDATVPEGGITARLLHSINLGSHGQWLAEVRAQLKKDGEHWIFKELGFPPLRESAERGSRGRPGPTTRELAAVAWRYCEYLKQRVRSPISEMAKMWGVSTSRARGWIERARRLQLLSPGQHGKADGYLMPTGEKLALAYLDEDPAFASLHRFARATRARKHTRR